MTSPTAAPQGKTEHDRVICEIEIAAPPERVFRALTDQQQLFTWWGKEPSVILNSFTMDARPGGKWDFRCVARPGADHGEVGEQLQKNLAQEFRAHGEVTELVPNRVVTWSWIANWHEHPEQRTLVRWELEPTKAGTRVRVTHSELANEPMARKDYAQGWLGVLKLLHEYVEQVLRRELGHEA